MEVKATVVVDDGPVLSCTLPAVPEIGDVISFKKAADHQDLIIEVENVIYYADSNEIKIQAALH
ncbi:MAG: hypothetical protein LKF01_01820 [Lactobacillus sp.]|jgi:hypothetical protein|nr:hypothetical protein [Lactobacillus sp.]MCH4068274.1 hypothetical protein [Lactobacillus sp.]MCI1304518.1 hypothetical protein [Lactobacillus sp.]MCI1330580.1 hypothetical protein [Lactobacillus sp.]MCI1359560.1 hypothetical protein [Lactobacillus sp.]